MKRIMNRLVTAEYIRELNAVEVDFKGLGLLSEYHETMDIAMNISLVYQTNQWLFKKKSFVDISPDAFMYFIKKWSIKACAIYHEHISKKDCKLALYTGAESSLYLVSTNELFEKQRSVQPGLELQIFSDLREAKSFLKQGKEPKVLI